MDIQIGIMTREAGGATIEEIAQVAEKSGVYHVQLSFLSLGLPPFPDPLTPTLCQAIRDGFLSHKVKIPVISGTFNAIDPNPSVRRAGVAGVARLLERCPDLGADYISICTGTRDPHHMWTYHPDNSTSEAWKDMVATMKELARIASGTEIILAFEPEPGNVVSSIAQALKLIEEVGSDRLKILCDPGNLFRRNDLSQMREILTSSILSAKGHIALAHAKDIQKPLPGDNELRYTSPGSGIMDFRLFIDLLSQIQYGGPLIMHGLTPEKITSSREFLEGLIRQGR